MKRKRNWKEKKLCPLCLNISLRNDKQISYYLFNVFLLSGGKSKSRFLKLCLKAAVSIFACFELFSVIKQEWKICGETESFDTLKSENANADFVPKVLEFQVVKLKYFKDVFFLFSKNCNKHSSIFMTVLLLIWHSDFTPHVLSIYECK